MKLKLTLTALVLLFSDSTAQTSYVKNVYEKLRNLDAITQFELQGLDINLKDKSVTYTVKKDNFFYFHIRSDHNGEPLYVLTYTNIFNVQTYFKRLQQITQRGAIKKIRSNKKTP